MKITKELQIEKINLKRISFNISRLEFELMMNDSETVLGAEGSAGVKRDAAGNIKKDIDELAATVSHNDLLPTTDMIVTLRDYCMMHRYPLPIVDIIEQNGTPNAPEFKAVCQVATIRRYGVSGNMKLLSKKRHMNCSKLL